MTLDGDKAEQYEEEHVHLVYEQIAEHFSSTRYKPWPIVEKFLLNQKSGSIGIDVGCGNGKYLGVNPNIFIVGSDRSGNLVKIAARHEPHDAIVGDTLSLPHPKAYFDFAISIAVFHHLSTPDRRVDAVRCLLECLKPGVGKALVYVWALEQDNSRRGWTAKDKQDVMVPWVRKAGRGKGEEQPKQDETFHRYYHLYRSGELEKDIAAAGGQIVECGYERDNWWAIAQRGSV